MFSGVDKLLAGWALLLLFAGAVVLRIFLPLFRLYKDGTRRNVFDYVPAEERSGFVRTGASVLAVVLILAGAGGSLLTLSRHVPLGLVVTVPIAAVGIAVCCWLQGDSRRR